MYTFVNILISVKVFAKSKGIAFEIALKRVAVGEFD